MHVQSERAAKAREKGEKSANVQTSLVWSIVPKARQHKNLVLPRVRDEPGVEASHRGLSQACLFCRVCIVTGVPAAVMIYLRRVCIVASVFSQACLKPPCFVSGMFVWSRVRRRTVMHTPMRTEAVATPHPQPQMCTRMATTAATTRTCWASTAELLRLVTVYPQQSS